MKEHLTKKAADWFQDPEAWKSFVQLIPLQAEIERLWLDVATDRLRNHFVECPCPGWQFQQWGVSHDTWWYLEEFGADSIGIGFGWRYYLCFGAAFGFRIDRDAVKQKLKEDTFGSLRRAFGRSDQITHYENAIEQFGDFSFGSDFDGRLPAHELAWYAGNKTDSFVEQAAAKIEAFARNPEITALFRQLNQELLTPPAIPTIRA